MSLRIIVAVIAVPVLAFLFTWATSWWVRSSMSTDSRIRRHARFLEILLWFGMMGIFAATAEKGKEQKLLTIVIGFVVAVWVFSKGSCCTGDV